MSSEIVVVLEHGKKWHAENYLEPFVSNNINVRIFTCAAQISILNNFHSLSWSSLHLVTRIPFFALNTIYNHLFCSARCWQPSFEIRVFLFTQISWEVIELWHCYLCTFCVGKPPKKPSVIHSDTYGGFKILRMSYFQFFFHLFGIQIPEFVHKSVENIS